MQIYDLETGHSAAVLRGIETEQTPSRASLAKELGLSRTTVSHIVSRLLDLGLVREAETGARGRGRPGIPLTLRDDLWYAASAAFEGGVWRFALTDLSGRIVVMTRGRDLADVRADFMPCLIEGLRDLVAQCPGRLLPLVGVGTPGTVDHARGRIIEAADMGFYDLPVSAAVRDALGVDASVINRHWAAGMAESRFGAGVGSGETIYVGIDTGIIAAFLQDGRLLTGSNYAAGEIGHNVLIIDGPVCACGKRGCLQALASERALLRDAAEADLFPAGEGNVRALVQMAEDGDEAARRCLDRFSTYLGLALSNLVNMFNPQRLILGGSPVDQGGEALVRRISARVADFMNARALAATRILPRALGAQAAPLGAALLVLDRKIELTTGGAIR